MESSKVEQRPVGNQGLVASIQGLGAMGMTAFYDTTGVTEEEKLDVFGKALEYGVNFIDTAWIYQNFQTGETNEELVGKALKKYGRDKFVLATKFGIVFKDGKMGTSGKRATIRQQCEDSLRRLDTEYIDLYYMHRMDPETPIEETMQALLELKNEGKIKYVGLSECTGEELERAHKVFPVTAIQMEWSLQSRDIEDTVLPVARRLGVAIVAYSPLGRGLLSRTFTKREELKDWRGGMPRFNEENFDRNVKMLDDFEAYAKNKGYTAGQLALAWVHAQGNDVFPIPGTKSVKRMEENAKAALIKLTPEELKEIEAIVHKVYGDRYDPDHMKITYQGRL